MTIITVWTVARSRLPTASRSMVPKPGIVNTRSITTAPTTSDASCTPTTVITGSAAFRSAEVKSTLPIDAPRDLPVLTYSAPISSRTDAATYRVRIEACTSASEATGSTACAGVPQPLAGSQPSRTENRATRAMPTRNDGTMMPTCDSAPTITPPGAWARRAR